MKPFEKQAIELLEKHLKISPAFLCMKLKVSEEKAQELCIDAWRIQHKEAYYLRRFGVSMKEFQEAI